MRLMIALIVLVLLFGCIEQRTTGSTLEKITNSQSQDLEGDGNPSYLIYDFAPVQIPGTSLIAQRQLLVSVSKQYQFGKNLNNLTFSDTSNLQTAFQNFDNARSAAELSCSKKLGLEGVVCIDAATCSQLCAASTPQCVNIASNYREALGGSIRDYIQTDNDIKTISTNMNSLLQSIQTTNPGDQYLTKVQSIANDIATMNANPIYNQFGLCNPNDFGVTSLLKGATILGNYSVTNITYHYNVIVTIKSAKTQDYSGEVLGLTLTDKLPKAILDSGQVNSKAQITTSEDISNAYLKWNPQKPAQAYMLIYDFGSGMDPDTVANSLSSPSFGISIVNVSALGSLLTFFINIAKNYYLALGLTLGSVAVVLTFIFTLITLIISMVGEKLGGGKVTNGIRREFSKAGSKWVGNGVSGILSLAVAYLLATFWVEQPQSIPGINEIPTFLLTNSTGIIPVILSLTGLVLLYTAVENLIKVTVSQKMYGSALKFEKENAVNKAATLKEEIKELKALVEKDRQENFDVSKEYDIAASVSVEKINELVKDPSQRSELMIDQEFARVDNAITSLKERKRTADEKWNEWSQALAKMLDERNEVYADSLLSIPSSLRLWALERFAREGGEGLVVERNVLKKKQVTPDRVLGEMIEQNLIKGAVVLKNEKLFVSKFAEGSGTVVNALSLKFRSYAQSLARNIGEGNTIGFAAIGEKVVTLYIKGKNIESILFISKDKYKEAVERWKLKTALFED